MKNKLYITLSVLFFVVTSVSAQKYSVGSYVFKDGSTYHGELVGKKPYGLGTCTWDNGDSYEGNWVLSRRSGHGVMIFSNASEKYEGEW